MRKVVWLTWDGIYNNAGICNKPLNPLPIGEDTPLADIKQRLKLLGFDCGDLNNDLDQNTKKALVTFNSYCNHPTINNLSYRCPMCGLTELLPNDKEIEGDRVLARGRGGNKLCPDHGNVCPNCKRKVDTPNNECEAHAKAPPRYHDDLTLQYLNELFPEGAGEAPLEPEPEPAENVVRLSRRTHENNEDLSTTINAVTELAVKIVSTPKSIIPFRQYAEIKLEINFTEEIKSMMLRVYRNFDEATDGVEISDEKLVYQEILDSDAIKSLPTNGHSKNVGETLMPRAYITRQVVGGGMTCSFGNYLGTSYERIDAPYKFRVWVSTKEEYDFGANVDDAENAAEETALEEARMILPFYLDQDILEKHKKILKESVSEPRGTKTKGKFPEPDIDYKTCVHDKSNEKAKNQTRGILDSWQNLRGKNTSLNRKSRWTKKDSEGINLTETTCSDHPPDYLKNNEIQLEVYASKFPEKPLECYRDLRNRFDTEGKEFHYHELGEVFENINRHINIIQRRLCCGQWSHVGARLNKEIRRYLERTVRQELNQLRQRQFPYDSSIRFVDKFLNYFEYIVHIALVRWELDFYEGFGEGEMPARDLTHGGPSKPGYSYFLANRRNVIDGNRTDKLSTYGDRRKQEYLKYPDDATRFFSLTEKAFDMMTKNAERKVAELAGTKDSEGWKRVAYPIVLPSYNVLDTYFFVKIRAVPMFVVGMLDMQYLTADGLRYNPGEFFGHDHFHIYTDGGKQQWLTLFERLCNLLSDEADPSREWDIYKLWQKNVEYLDFLINFYQGNQLETLKFLLFCVLHEPQGSSTTNPTLVERDLIRKRLEDPGLPGRNKDYIQYIKGQDLKDFFGTYTRPYMADLDWAKQEIMNTYLPRLGDLHVNDEGRIELTMPPDDPPPDVEIE